MQRCGDAFSAGVGELSVRGKGKISWDEEPPQGYTRVCPYVLYEDASTAVEYLTTKFGFGNRPPLNSFFTQKPLSSNSHGGPLDSRDEVHGRIVDPWL